MTLARGSRIGLYEIIAPLGAGGMGEVYRARDTKLGRDVALKLLPDAFADDADRLARFEREAKILATLNHPYIANIYGLSDFSGGDSSDKDGGRRGIALVMELVEGEDLAQQLTRGAISLDEALPIARQIAEALEAAHEQGIVHRDLKPANIKVKEDGTVKVLDFGLAKAIEPATSADVTTSPTLTARAMTQVGMILGTAAYMAPEQARGKRVDRRADIWAFGCVMYEMLAGTRAFAGDEVSDVLASVLAREPDWTRLPAGISPMLRTCLQRCLAKDPRQRIRDVGDLRLVLEGAFDGGAVAAVLPAPPERRLWSRALPWAVAGLSSIVAASLLVLWAPWQQAPMPSAVRLSAAPATGATLAATPGGAGTVISPDGGTLAFIGTVGANVIPQIFVRRLDEFVGTPLAGTENAGSLFFSPDGNWIAFSASGKLKKVPTGGGAVVTIASVTTLRGGTWTSDGWIVFAGGTTSALSRVPAAGGTPEPATTLGPGEVSHRWPQALDGNAVLYSASESPTTWADASLIVQNVPMGPRTVVHQGGHYGRLLPNGYLVYVRGGVLFGAPFDAGRRQFTSAPVPVLDGVASFDPSGVAQFSFARNGTLAYVPGEGIGSSEPIAWIDRAGQVTTFRAVASEWSNPQFSPDGKRLAMDIADGPNTDVWIDDWTSDSMKRLTLEASPDQKPIWTPDGQQVTYSSARGDKSTLNLYSQRPNGAGEAQRLTDSKNPQLAGSWHPSGKYLAFTEVRPGTGQDLMILPMDGDSASGLKPGAPTVFLGTPAAESEPMFSPDGRWVAYQSNESGTTEVFVRPFPGQGSGSKWQLSSDAGANPTWSRTRAELFYRSANARLMVVSYKTEGDAFIADPARPVANVPLGTRPRQRYFDLHPDGNRIVAAPPRQDTPTLDKVVFVFNFFDELRGIVAARR